MWEWPAYAASTVAILWSGYHLVRTADGLAARWGWTRGWAGLVLLATITSLPELLSGASAVLLAAAPRIALGAAVGSLAFNLLILGAVLASGLMRLRGLQDWNLPSTKHAATLTAFALALFLAAPVVAAPWDDWVLLSLLPLYLIAMWRIHDQSQSGTHVVPDAGRPWAFAFHALVVVLASGILAFSGAAIADNTGLGRTFVGGLFVAMSTSLPEVAVTWAAIRIQAPSLAIGNLVGSNLFVLATLSVYEAASLGPLLHSIDASQIWLLAVSLVMTLLAWAGLKGLRDRLAGFLLVALFVAAHAASFMAR
jgi:cation:H+ antiporter